MSDVLERPAAAPAQDDGLKVVGTRPIRPDGADKVTGKALYGADLAMPGMLVGKIKRSPHAHARIVSIDTRKARALPGVKAVVTAADFPDLASEEYEAGESAVQPARPVAERDGPPQGALSTATPWPRWRPRRARSPTRR